MISWAPVIHWIENQGVALWIDVAIGLGYLAFFLGGLRARRTAEKFSKESMDRLRDAMHVLAAIESVMDYLDALPGGTVVNKDDVYRRIAELLPRLADIPGSSDWVTSVLKEIEQDAP